MAGASLLTLLDDISTILDDVSLMTKVAAKKTAGVLGDDLALNAQQVSGVQADRELPVVWAVGKGSLMNKAILVPTALVISAFAPWAVMPLLMIGGAYLCYEGFEKLAHKLLHSAGEDAERHAQHAKALADTAVDVVGLEKERIRGAVRTDFILSAEIIAITLGTVADAPLLSQLTVLAGIAVLMTVGVYGLVAAIVKLDDLGFYLSRRGGALQGAGEVLVQAAPLLMRGLTVVGTAAMFLVGGGIVAHGLPPVHHAIENFADDFSGPLQLMLPPLAHGVLGIVVGAVVLAVVSGALAVFGKKAKASA